MTQRPAPRPQVQPDIANDPKPEFVVVPAPDHLGIRLVEVVDLPPPAKLGIHLLD